MQQPKAARSVFKISGENGAAPVTAIVTLPPNTKKLMNFKNDTKIILSKLVFNVSVKPEL